MSSLFDLWVMVVSLSNHFIFPNRSFYDPLLLYSIVHFCCSAKCIGATFILYAEFQHNAVVTINQSRASAEGSVDVVCHY